MNEPYIYILVRDDLKSTGYKATMSIHAAMKVAEKYCSNLPPEIETPNIVLCKVKDTDELLDALINITTHGIRIVDYYEPDLDNQFVSICTEPVYGDKRKIFSQYKLLKG